ncbi:hypothetical protein PIB30_005600 [Stylosanthes scabra]|uniref:Uncharacterized protein n=1 Tax=Stylosanthes scabra TaxID=79078 RepID=A0ABU6S3V8_9FABA|nr:hypothetical protein [Stylosanthes scabra]
MGLYIVCPRQKIQSMLKAKFTPPPGPFHRNETKALKRWRHPRGGVEAGSAFNAKGANTKSAIMEKTILQKGPLM